MIVTLSIYQCSMQLNFFGRYFGFISLNLNEMNNEVENNSHGAARIAFMTDICLLDVFSLKTTFFSPRNI